MQNRILIVDDEGSIRSSLQDIFEDEGMQATVAQSAEDAMALFQKKGYDCCEVILLDIWMPGMDGMEFLDWLKKNYPKIPVVMISGHGNVETAVKATKKGAYDFIEKPLSLEKVILTVNHALKEYSLERENETLRQQTQKTAYDIIGHSPKIEIVREQINMAAPSDGWVLIQGENGTGKELVAKQIHRNSNRKDKPFVEVNCAAIPEELIESELFGHEKGSFTGAVTKKIGKFDLANQGTLFLDEIGDMSLRTQAKILRFLQEQNFERIGGSELHEVDVRIIAASNKDLLREIEEGNFREDLYYRLNVIPIEVPPLRERYDDIEILVRFFINQFVSERKYTPKEITEEAMRQLSQYNWPGNIRELKNIIERMLIMVPGDKLEYKHIPPAIRSNQREIFHLDNFSHVLKEASIEFERQFIQSMLLKYNWNISKTAELIQIERGDLQQKIKQLDIAIPRD